MKPKAGSLEGGEGEETDKPLARLTNMKKEKTIINIRMK